MDCEYRKVEKSLDKGSQVSVLLRFYLKFKDGRAAELISVDHQILPMDGKFQLLSYPHLPSWAHEHFYNCTPFMYRKWLFESWSITKKDYEDAKQWTLTHFNEDGSLKEEYRTQKTLIKEEVKA